MGCGCNNKPKIASKADPVKGYMYEDIQPVDEQLNIKEGPSLLKKALNFGEALVDHVADGLTTVTSMQLSSRLAVCNKCPFNNEGSCMKCGCVIATKAKWRSSSCPAEYWPTIKEE